MTSWCFYFLLITFLLLLWLSLILIQQDQQDLACQLWSIYPHQPSFALQWSKTQRVIMMIHHSYLFELYFCLWLLFTLRNKSRLEIKQPIQKALQQKLPFSYLLICWERSYLFSEDQKSPHCRFEDRKLIPWMKFLTGIIQYSWKSAP